MTTATDQPNIFESEQAMTTATNENAVSVVNSNPMTLIQTAIEHKADPEQLGKLMDLQERYERNMASKAFASAMAEFQARCPIIHKAKKGGHGNYAPYDEIDRQTRAIRTECGLSVAFEFNVSGENRMDVVCVASHVDGHSERYNYQGIPIPSDMRVNDTQKYGALLSYGKRYAYQLAFNIVVSDEDNDGKGLGDSITEKQAIILQDMVDQLDEEASRRFFAWAGVDDVVYLPANRYDVAFRGLKKSLGGK